MVLQYNFQHLFKHPVEDVVNSYMGIHRNQDDLKNVENIDSTIEDSDTECTRRRLTVDNYFSPFFQKIKLLKKDVIEVYEEIWSQKKERNYWVRTKNSTWENELTIAKTAYISPHQSNKNWTVWDEAGVLDLGHFGKIGLALEFYLKRKLERNLQRDMQLIEKTLK